MEGDRVEEGGIEGVPLFPVPSFSDMKNSLYICTYGYNLE